MMKKSGRLLAILLVFVMIFSLTACGGGSADDGDQQGAVESQKTEYKRSNMGNKVNSPNKVYYFVENPIEITEINAFKNGDPKPEDYPDAWTYCEMIDADKEQYDENEARFDGRYIQISGLKDKSIEAKVNEKLRNLYLEYVDFIPPYRGVKVLIGEEPVTPDSKYYYPTISMYSSGNLNNILSVTLSGYNVFEDARGEYYEWDGTPLKHYISYMETINIDLNTGEEIPLESMFCDNIDPFEYLDGRVMEELREGNADEEGWYPGTDVQLAGKFEGIKPSQKYSLGISGITLIFDYETPELNTYNLSYSTMLIPYDELTAVTARFYDADENIYESGDEPIKMFPYEYGLRQTPVKEESYQVDGTWVYLYATSLEGIPEVLTKKVEDFVAVTDDEVREALSPEMSEALMMKNPETKIESQFSRNASVMKNGPFVTIHKSENKYIYEYGYANEDYLQEYESWNEVYDLRKVKDEDPQPMELEDIFYDGVDVEARIKHAMREAIIRHMSYEVLPENVEDVLNMDGSFEAYIDAVYDDIKGFSIDRKHIVLAFNDINSIYCETYGVENVSDIAYGWRVVYAPQELTYADLGYENITLFD